MQSRVYFFAALAIFFWSTVATAFKFALKTITYPQLLLYSSLFSTLCLFIILIVEGKLKLLLISYKNNWKKSAFLGLLNPFAYYFVLFKAYSILPAQQAQPLNYTWPIVLVLFSLIFLKEKINVMNLIGLAISFIGVIVIATDGNFAVFKISHPFGVFLAVGSSLLWATYWLLNMKDTLQISIRMFLNFLFGTIYILIIFIIFSFPFTISIEAFFLCMYIGIFEMGLTFIIWGKTLNLSKSTLIAHFVYLSPFLSLIFINYILKENVHFSAISGLSFIIAGIILSKTRLKPKFNG